MDQDRVSKFDPQYFSTPNLFSSHLSKIVEQTGLYSSFNASKLGKILSQYDKMTALPEIPKLSKGLLESLSSTKGLFANSELSEAILRNVD